MQNVRRATLSVVAAGLALVLLSGCIPMRPRLELENLQPWLEASSIVDSVVHTTEPHERDGESDRQIFTVDLDDSVTAGQLGTLLDELNTHLKSNYSLFKGGVVRFAVQPGHNEMSVELASEAAPGQFAAGAATWFQLGEHFEVFQVSMRYVDRLGWSMERESTVELGDVPWRDASAALRTLTAVGAFGSDGGSGLSTTWVNLARSSPWWADGRSAAIGYDVGGGGPSEEMLAALDALSDLEAEGAVSFDFSGGPWRNDGSTLGVLAVVPVDAGADAGWGAAIDGSRANFDEFSASAPWAMATRIVDVLAARDAPFSLAIRVEGEAVNAFATVDSESCTITETAFSQQLTDYWRSIGGSC